MPRCVPPRLAALGRARTVRACTRGGGRHRQAPGRPAPHLRRTAHRRGDGVRRDGAAPRLRRPGRPAEQPVRPLDGHLHHGRRPPQPHARNDAVRALSAVDQVALWSAADELLGNGGGSCDAAATWRAGRRHRRPRAADHRTEIQAAPGCGSTSPPPVAVVQCPESATTMPSRCPGIVTQLTAATNTAGVRRRCSWTRPSTSSTRACRCSSSCCPAWSATCRSSSSPTTSHRQLGLLEALAGELALVEPASPQIDPPVSTCRRATAGVPGGSVAPAPVTSSPWAREGGPARLDDAEAIMEIYNAEVTTSTVTFDIVPRTLEEQRRYLTDRSGAHAVVVATVDGEVVGYGALSPWRSKPAYSTSVEDSVYVRRDHQRRGVGRALLAELTRVATAHGFHAMFARIVDGTPLDPAPRGVRVRGRRRRAGGRPSSAAGSTWSSWSACSAPGRRPRLSRRPAPRRGGRPSERLGDRRVDDVAGHRVDARARAVGRSAAATPRRASSTR